MANKPAPNAVPTERECPHCLTQVPDQGEEMPRLRIGIGGGVIAYRLGDMVALAIRLRSTAE